jgi:hypothetical protein
MKRLVDDGGQIAHVMDEVVVLNAGPGDSYRVNFLKASVPISGKGTWPVITTIGVESRYALAIPVTALVAPWARRHQDNADAA